MNEMEADNAIATGAVKREDAGDGGQAALVLHLQTEIMEKIAAIQEGVRNAVINRQWADFESLLKTMNRYGDQFQELEARRAALFSGLFEGGGAAAENRGEAGGPENKAAFYRGASRLPEAERRELAELYRNLKLRALKARMANESLASYLCEAKATVDSFLDAAYPDRKNRFYSRRGAKVPADMRSLVVNQSL
ncbi:MAG: hypothetical protein LBD13_02630 [Spirochaetaceae bacterium]|jgi:hypothetical protein|nr:hypothetical protein [Spirochaetaceae bacterium]